MQQCPNGHLYDDSKNSSCPFCSGSGMNATVPLAQQPQPQPAPAVDAFPKTMPLNQPAPAAAPQEIPQTAPVSSSIGVTTYVNSVVNAQGIVEVRGWLVCLDGARRGEDFTIRGEKNTIGRGVTNDIKLDFDNSISKGVNAIIAYDSRNNKFIIAPGADSKNNMYVNDELLMIPVEIRDYDIIEIGQTKMIFRSLCNEKFNWPKEEKKDNN